MRAMTADGLVHLGGEDVSVVVDTASGPSR
jgi:hypothetical protein